MERGGGISRIQVRGERGAAFRERKGRGVRVARQRKGRKQSIVRVQGASEGGNVGLLREGRYGGTSQGTGSGTGGGGDDERGIGERREGARRGEQREREEKD